MRSAETEEEQLQLLDQYFEMKAEELAAARKDPLAAALGKLAKKSQMNKEQQASIYRTY